MNLPHRLVALSLLSGLLCATAAPIMADEMPSGFDTSRLVKFADRDYLVDYEDWVSTEPLSTSRIKKVEGGRVSYVTVTQTATGTYSTDGMTSPHVLYPGIAVEAVTAQPNRVAVLSYGGNSFVYLRNRGTTIVSTPARTCISTASFTYC